MQCPECGGNTVVRKTEGQVAGNYTLRVRACVACGVNFKTCEKYTYCVKCGNKMRTSIKSANGSGVIRVKYCEKCFSAQSTVEN